MMSCAKQADTPVTGDVNRFPDFFDPVEVLISDAVDADITAVIKGPGTGDEGNPWVDANGNRWAVVSGLRNGNTVVYKFLGCDANGSNKIYGPELSITDEDYDEV